MLAVRFWTKLRGLLFDEPHNHILALCPCRSVHTFGMRHPIDVAFLDEEGRVVKVVRSMQPWRREGCFKAVLVLERFASEKEWFPEGTMISLDLLP